MKRYAEIYSEKGLRNLIENYKQKIADKEKEFNEVKERYNPLCADGWRREINIQIKGYKNTLKELEKALEEKLK